MADCEHEYRRPLALVTGATSGIGRAFAQRLGADGHDLIVHGRRLPLLESLAAGLRAEHRVKVEILIADLARSEDLLRLEERLRTGEVEFLVNNAGFTHLAPFDELDVDVVEEMIRVHVLALTRLTHAALPAMMEHGRGTIINVSSDGVFVTYPSPKMAVYAATKTYVNTFTRALHELAGPRGVRVQALWPGLRNLRYPRSIRNNVRGLGDSARDRHVG
jgi:short-subunit dehydrogenase